MKIDALSPSLTAANLSGNSRGKAVSSARSDAASTSEGSEVQLSPLSSQLQAMDEAEGSNGSGEIDTAKVNAIKQAIVEGRFSINAGAIADRLLGSAQELLSGRKTA